MSIHGPLAYSLRSRPMSPPKLIVQPPGSFIKVRAVSFDAPRKSANHTRTGHSPGVSQISSPASPDSLIVNGAACFSTYIFFSRFAMGAARSSMLGGLGGFRPQPSYHPFSGIAGTALLRLTFWKEVHFPGALPCATLKYRHTCLMEREIHLWGYVNTIRIYKATLLFLCNFSVLMWWVLMNRKYTFQACVGNGEGWQLSQEHSNVAPAKAEDRIIDFQPKMST